MDSCIRNALHRCKFRCVFCDRSCIFIDATIQDNVAPQGGGIYTDHNLSLVNVTITNNGMNNGTGGGIYNQEGEEMADVTVTIYEVMGNGSKKLIKIQARIPLSKCFLTFIF